MLKSRFSWTILFLGLAILGGAWILFSQESSADVAISDELTEAPIAGYFAPSFTLPTTLGVEVSLSDFRGQPAVLNFWASWCPPCRIEIPHLEAVSTKYNGRAVILGIDQGEPPSVVADFGAAMSVTYPLLVDERSEVNRLYGIAALPTTVFIDADGIVREVYTGIINQAVLEERIERILADG